MHTWAEKGKGTVVIIFVNVRKDIHTLRTDLLVCAKNNDLESKMVGEKWLRKGKMPVLNTSYNL